jgi:hypothetical protein
MKTFIVLLLLSVSALGAETDIQVISQTTTNAEGGTGWTKDIFTRNGQTNLIRVTNVRPGQKWSVYHFYHAGQLVANFVADSASGRFNTEAGPYCVSLTYGPSGQIVSAAIGDKAGTYLDEFGYTNGLLSPIPGPIVRNGLMKPKFAPEPQPSQGKAN